MRVFKYPIELGVTVHNTSTMFKALYVAYQGPQLTLWAEVGAKPWTSHFATVTVVGTGHSYDDIGDYVGTVFHPDLSLTWHVFVKVEEEIG